MYVRVCICVYLYHTVYVCAVLGLWVCVYGALTCIYAAFSHVSMDAYYMCTTHLRPYIYVAYDGYILAQRRVENTSGREPQGSALAAASSALRRLHSLQLFLMR